MEVIAALAFAKQLITGIGNAVAAGRSDVSDDDLDAALDELGASDQRLTDAIARAREREAGG